MQNLYLPSFFFARTIPEFHGLLVRSMHSSLSMLSTSVSNALHSRVVGPVSLPYWFLSWFKADSVLGEVCGARNLLEFGQHVL